MWPVQVFVDPSLMWLSHDNGRTGLLKQRWSLADRATCFPYHSSGPFSEDLSLPLLWEDKH